MRYAAPVADLTSEVLVELQPGATIEDAVPAEAAVLQRFPPRLAIVAADAAGIDALRASAFVNAVFDGEVPPEALDRLDQMGRVFATGWNERSRPKRRRGEGLPWDTPGFDAP
jgi:hypothetical protein